MNRQAIYSESRTRRVVSTPGGLWQAQTLSAEPATRERDPWRPVGRPTSLEEAKRQAQLGRGDTK